jgi:uncharacterized membrane protein YukC
MNSRIIIVDDLYDIGHQYHKGFFENHSTVTKETIEKITEILRKEIEIISESNEVLLQDQKESVCCHLGSDWIAVIYLSIPLVSFGEYGIRFYSHKETRLEQFSEKLRNNFSQNLDLWKEYGKIPAKYNRMILFRSDLWHSYGEGFGSDKSSGLLFQKLILKEK